jgi:hypothetical protein
VALARRLAVIMRRMLVDRTVFNAMQRPERRSNGFRVATTQAFSKRSPFAGTMVQVRPQSVQWDQTHDPGVSVGVKL